MGKENISQEIRLKTKEKYKFFFSFWVPPFQKQPFADALQSSCS